MTSTDVDETVMRKIRALKLRAEGTTFPEEAERCIETIKRLAMKHSIDVSMLDAEDLEAGRITPGSFECVLWAPHSTYKWYVFNSIFEQFSCRTVGVLKEKGNQHLLVYGFESDLDLGWTLWEIISDHMLKDMEINCGSGASEKKAYMLGFANRIEERLRAYYKEVVEEMGYESTSTDLVLASKIEKVSELLEEKHPNMRQQKVSYRHDPESYQAGIESAEKANISIDQFDEVTGKVGVLS